jgi:hypothetical protein
MSTANVVAGHRLERSMPADVPPAVAVVPVGEAAPESPPNGHGGGERRERFIPITRFALRDRLTRPQSWPPGQAAEARRFFLYLDYWRRQAYNAELHDLEQAYEPFSPDSDLLATRQFTEEEQRTLQRRVVEGMQSLLERSNYTRVDPSEVELILTKESHYGLDLYVDLSAFEELLIFSRGAVNRRDSRRSLRKFYAKEEFDVPIYQRLFVLFKLKPLETRVREVMAAERMSRRDAERHVRKLRALIPAGVKDGNIYMKLFKNMPRSDLEMVFPNTRVKFRLKDKIKFGVTSGGAFGMGIAGTAGKIAAGGILATNPVALAGALAGLGGVAFRQAVAFMNQRQKYMVVMAQNLYFHAMADNRGVMIKLGARAAEEDVKEEMLLYSVLAKEPASRRDLPAIDMAIEQYMTDSFGIRIDFDLEDALARLIRDGLVTEDADGTLRTLPPAAAAELIDRKWDRLLDELVLHDGEGFEHDGDGRRPNGAA